MACNDQRSGEVDHSKHISAANTVAASHDHAAMISSPGADEAPYDLQFIDTMIAHHQGAIDMAKLAAGRADDDDLKQLTTEIIEDQGEEITKMTEWRNAWFPDKPKPAMNMDLPGMSHGMSGMDLAKLQTLNGTEFDKEFVNQMIPHHEGAIEMAKDLANRSQRTELKELAGAIVTDQQAEIEDMKEWADEWKNE
ncbi:MAG: DUF305 domain-containing protein [Acidobacteria bacterium]|nr:MAG: DUF305 domain-containing protein [Acidobacteriota bacterium]